MSRHVAKNVAKQLSIYVALTTIKIIAMLLSMGNSKQNTLLKQFVYFVDCNSEIAKSKENVCHNYPAFLQIKKIQ